MTDQHPLTDEIIDTFASPQYDYFEGIGEINLGYDYDDLRAAADWQLEQVIEWLYDNLGNNSYLVTIGYCGAIINVDCIIESLLEAMCPTTTTQEDDND